jgi:hypothetical protein
MNSGLAAFYEFIKDHNAYVILEYTMAIVRCHTDECETCKNALFITKFSPVTYLYHENLAIVKKTHPEYFI